MKVTKKIQKSFNKYMKAKDLEQELLKEIYNWVEKQGIDATDNDFADAIGVRIGNNEFDSAEHFFDEVKRYKAGDDVGYG